MCRYVAESAKIGENCTLGENVVILENVEIGDSSYIGHNVVLHHGTRVGRNAHIEDGAILGRMPRSGQSSTRKVRKDLPPLEIGNDCIIGANVVLYAGTKIGDEVMIGDLASIREQNVIGDRSIVGRAAMLEYENVIGKSVVMQVCTGLGGTLIEDEAFLGPHVVCPNDMLMGRLDETFRGPHIKRRARIGSNATLLPGITIGEEAVIGAGSVVTKDIPGHTIAAGAPARGIKDVPQEQLKKKADFQA
jgi:acetyltransferase-like isoleucine patch superfamily enzyme